MKARKVSKTLISLVLSCAMVLGLMNPIFQTGAEEVQAQEVSEKTEWDLTDDFITDEATYNAQSTWVYDVGRVQSGGGKPKYDAENGVWWNGTNKADGMIASDGNSTTYITRTGWQDLWFHVPRAGIIVVDIEFEVDQYGNNTNGGLTYYGFLHRDSSNNVMNDLLTKSSGTAIGTKDSIAGAKVKVRAGDHIRLTCCSNVATEVKFTKFHISYQAEADQTEWDLAADFITSKEAYDNQSVWEYDVARIHSTADRKKLAYDTTEAAWYNGSDKTQGMIKAGTYITGAAWQDLRFYVPKSGTLIVDIQFDVKNYNHSTENWLNYFFQHQNTAGTSEPTDLGQGSIQIGTTGMISAGGRVEAKTGEVIRFTCGTNHSAEITFTKFVIKYVSADKEEFDYTEDFNTNDKLLGANNWYYRPNKDSNPIFSSGAWICTNDGAGAYAGQIKNNKVITATWETSEQVVFKAPKSGIISVGISFDIAGYNNGSFTYVNYWAYKDTDDTFNRNNKEYMDEGYYPQAGSYSQGFTVEVTAGDNIVFEFLSSGGQAEVTFEEFIVKYVDSMPPTYAYETEYSKETQGPQWYYMSADLEVNRYTQLDEFNSSENRWISNPIVGYKGGVGYNYIWPGSVKDNAIAFKAPYTGTIKISASPWISGDSNGDVELSVLKGIEGEAVENLYPGGDLTASRTFAAGDAANIAVSGVKVQKGEWIYFRVHAKGANDGDIFYITPTIRYIYYDEADRGISGTVLESGADAPYIAETKHTEAGTNLDAAAFPMVERTYNGSYTSITSEGFVAGLKAGTLASGGYTISDDVLTLDSSLNYEVVDADGIFVKVSQGVVLEAVDTARIKNLTVEVTGDASALLTTVDVRDLRLLGWQLSYSGSGAQTELLKTEGTASARTKADLVLDGLRFVGNGTVKGITFTDAVHYGTLKNSYISGVKDYAVKDSGTSAEGIYVGDSRLVGDVRLTKESAVLKYNTIEGNVEATGAFTLLAMNNIECNVSVENAGAVTKVQSVQVSGNVIGGDLTVSNGWACAIVENTATKITVTGGSNCIVEDNNGSKEIKAPVSSVTVSGTDHYGSNVYDQSVREEVGVNDDLLAKVDNSVFAGIDRKYFVNDGGVISTVEEYLEGTVETEDTVYLAPGAYGISYIRFDNEENLRFFMYGSLLEGDTSRAEASRLSLYNCTKCEILGATVGFDEAPMGQGTITEIGEDGDGEGWFIVTAHPGYYPDFSENEHYAKGFYCLVYPEGSDEAKLVTSFHGRREYLGNGQTKIWFLNDYDQSYPFESVVVGDTFACRSVDTRFITFGYDTECLVEDVTAFTTVGAIVADMSGTKNYYNRVSAVRGFGYEASQDQEMIVDCFNDSNAYEVYLADCREKGWIQNYNGKEYGPSPIWTVGDGIRPESNYIGPQVTNYRANNKHDDGFNIQGYTGKVIDYARNTKTVKYDGGLSGYNSYPGDFKAGDRVLIYELNTGKIIAETTAASATETYDTYRTVKLTDSVADLVWINNRAICIVNVDRQGHGFLYDNCEFDTGTVRGGVVKASGTFKNCTIKSSGKQGMIVTPEILSSGFAEGGFVSSLEILSCEFENTNLIGALNDENSALVITGEYDDVLGEGYVKQKNILIQGCSFTNWGAHAIYLQTVENVRILDNTFIDADALNENRTPISLKSSEKVEISGNHFPEGYNRTTLLERTTTTKRIYGLDIGGDVTNDGEIDARDLVRMKKNNNHEATNTTDGYFETSDFDGSGVIDASDIPLMRWLLIKQ